MGKSKGPYVAEYPEGSTVITADRVALDRFRAEWRYHNKLQPEQLLYSSHIARVVSVMFYHGADEIYVLDGVPGVWHEQCLRAFEE
jgi:hypothetical protein